MKLGSRSKLWFFILSFAAVITMISIMAMAVYADDNRQEITRVEFNISPFIPDYGIGISSYSFIPDGEMTATVGAPAYISVDHTTWYRRGEYRDIPIYRDDALFEEGTYYIQFYIYVDQPDSEGNSKETHVISPNCTAIMGGVEWDVVNVEEVNDGSSYMIVQSPDYRICLHDLEPVLTPATRNTAGSTRYFCVKCGDEREYHVIPRITDITLSTTTYTYNGNVKSPKLTVKNEEGTTLKNGTDYTCTVPSGRKNVGTYTYRITFKGKYRGSASVSFKILPPKTAITKIVPASKALTVTWKKKTSQVSGYRIQYATNSKFKDPKYATIPNNKTTSKKISKLTSRKTYYVRIQTYKLVNGKKIYSNWSTAVPVKVK